MKNESVKNECMKNKKVSLEEMSLESQIKRLNTCLSKLKENLKPLWKKKYLISYIDFKKKSNNLKADLVRLEQIYGTLPDKIKKKIIKKINLLNTSLEKPIINKSKKKKYKKIIHKIQSFTEMLKNSILL